METISLFNGNNQRYTLNLPKITILAKSINKVALKHIKKNTGLNFIKVLWGYESKPKTSKQILKLLLTYDFKTQYHNNATNKITLFLRFCGLEGFKTRAICYNCVKYNNIVTNGLNKKTMLSI